eukprot:m.23326 g.23326  ORF g.23326 m.23326 type:complete len:372 (-) comp8964_c0_seq1:635-1750(-)
MDFIFVSVLSRQENNLTSISRGISKAKCSEMNIPQLRVGTLDELISLSDDLHKADLYMEGVTHKLTHQLGELKSSKAELIEAITADRRPLEQYLARFDWDSRRFNVKLSVRDISNQLKELVTKIEMEMKGRVQSYNQLKSKLQAEDRKTQGTLLIRSLVDIVTSDHVVGDSEFLTTLLVVVPKYAYSEWESSYAKLTEFVCPGSSELVTEDSDYGLFTVTLFKKIVDDFKAAAREKKFTVREFEYQEDEVQTSLEERDQMMHDFKEKHSQLSDWLQLSLDEAFTSWVHIKALRLFVESVLRYGLPPRFTYFALAHTPDNERKVRNDLKKLYGDYDKTNIGGGDDTVDIPGMQHGEYFPYVSASLKLQYFIK